MSTPLKGLLFLLLGVALLRAGPAQSVPLPSSTDPGSSVSDVKDDDGKYDPYQKVGDDSEGTEAKARIVDSDKLAQGPEAPQAAYGTTGKAAMSSGGRSGSPGWLKPVGAVGAGSALYFVLAGKGKDDNGGSAGNPINTSGGTPGLTTLGGHDETPGGDQPSAVPEPGTLAMLGIGIASYLGRIAKKKTAKKK